MARALVVLHALLALALGGAATHLALVALAFFTGRPERWRNPKLARVYAQVAGWLFAGALVAGALTYPAYRYHVRGLYLDRYAPWASNLFDFKETIAALGLPFALGLVLLGRRFDPDDADFRLVFAVCAFVVFAVVAFDVVSGLAIVTVRSV